MSGVALRDAALGLAELLDDALDGRRGLFGRRLERFAQRSGDEHRPPLQIAEETLALFTNLQIGEHPDDEHHREPDRADQPQGESQVASTPLSGMTAPQCTLRGPRASRSAERRRAAGGPATGRGGGK
jgi:hypothetical protein